MAPEISVSDASKSYFSVISKESLVKTMEIISKDLPTFESHIEAFVEAEDPEAGIEEDYHPKHDAVYCWRARRLLAAKKLIAFEDMSDGDLAKGLKRMNKFSGGATIKPVVILPVDTAAPIPVIAATVTATATLAVDETAAPAGYSTSSSSMEEGEETELKTT